MFRQDVLSGILFVLEDVAGDSTLSKQSDFVSEHVVSISRSKREAVMSAVEMTSCRVVDWVQDIASEKRRFESTVLSWSSNEP